MVHRSSMALGAVVFADLAYYARERWILWVGIPAQDCLHVATGAPIDLLAHDMHAPLVPA